MNVISFRSSVTAEEMSFGAVEDDRIEFHGDTGGRSRATTERRNLPPAVTPHSSYRDVRIDLGVEVEVDPQAGESPDR